MSTFTSIFSHWKDTLKLSTNDYHEKLQEIVERLNQAENLIQGAIFIQDYRDFSVKYASKNAFAICGYFPENFYANGIELGLQLHHPEDRSKVLVLQKQVFDYLQTIPKDFRDSLEINYIARIFNRKQDRYQITHATIKPLLFDAEHNVILDIAHWKAIPTIPLSESFSYTIKYIDVEGNVHQKNNLMEDDKKSISALTKTEQEITALLKKGLTSTQISEKLNRSKHTVDTHRRNILKKLGLKSTRELLILRL
ncbi:helix-turn-helix transcriptional regulator [Winogradskyella sp.]|uniref:helix-turn-helix domain-containing protein n=1 Tax=Winogradskyella sp. TaxID=1883156 RepID=UPI0026194F12|nr:helix-turn-helix transcriptional regulator [Winogradskyella sp.]